MASDTMRVFFAIELPDALKQAIMHLQSELQPCFKKGAIRWVQPHHWHITLHFLAAIKAEDVPSLLDRVKKEIQDIPPFKIPVSDIELFPTPYRPKVISLHIPPHELISRLVTQIGQGIVALNYAIETRPFRAHITLGRFNYSLRHDAKDFPKAILEDIAVKEIILYHSEPTNRGSSYNVLGRIALAAS